jgi:lysophospholipase L1-like esterase
MAEHILKKDFLLACGSLIVVVMSILYAWRTEGIVFWMALSSTILGIIGMLHYGITALFAERRKYIFRVQNILLVVISSLFVLIVFEGFLGYREGHSYQMKENEHHRVPERDYAFNGKNESMLEKSLLDYGVQVPPDIIAKAAWRLSLMTMPLEWEKQSIQIEGTAYAYKWHGITHIHDINDMRRMDPFPPKSQDVFRILVMGDSLTYGYGIEEQYTYAHQLQELLQDTYNVEILNLGDSGNQSEDVLRAIQRFLPGIQPDLIIYGVCLNDFLPSGIGEYQVNDAYSFPLPESVKEFFTKRSRVAKLANDAYSKALITFGLRADFFDDILKNFRDYQTRFGHDVKKMNEFVKERGLSPIVAIVLDQFPNLGLRGYQISQIAERYLKAAGMTVVETKEYYDRFNGQNFAVSKWEGHPNEIANAIWAKMIYAHLKNHTDLQRFRKS